MEQEKKITEVEAFEKATRRRRTTELTFRLYSLVGISAAVTAFAYTFFQESNQSASFGGDEPKSWLTLIVFFGTVLAVVAQFSLVYYREVQSKKLYEMFERDKLIKFLERWNELEDTSIRLIGQHSHVVSLRELINKLLDRDLLNRADADSLESALAVRNAIIHGRTALPYDMIDKQLAELTRVIDNIHAHEINRMGG